MIRPLSILGALVFALAATGCGPFDEAKDTQANGLLPTGADLPGWRRVAVTSPDVDRAEPLLFADAGRMAALEPKSVTAARYVPATGDAVLEVRIWRMPSSLEAAGALSYGRRGQASRLVSGWGSWVSDEAFAGVFDSMYVEALVRGEVEAGQVLLTQLAHRIDARFGRRIVAEPEGFAVLPVDGRLPDSLRYDPRLRLGPIEMPQVVAAGYRLNGFRGELFVARYEDKASAEGALRDVILSVDIDRPLGPEGTPGVYGRLETIGPLSAAVRGRYLVLLTGPPERREHLAMMRRVWTRVDALPEEVPTEETKEQEDWLKRLFGS